MKVVELAVRGVPVIADWPDISLKRMQDFVGGYIETAFRLESPESPMRSIDVYCNEEGLLMGLPFNIITPMGTPIVGNVLFVAADETTGETVELTPNELVAIEVAFGLTEHLCEENKG